MKTSIAAILLLLAITPLSADVINVIDAGAIGDGVHNDGPAIAEAVLEAEPGSTIYFPAGVYYVAEPMPHFANLKSLRLTGEGNASVIKSAGGNNPRIMTFLDCEDIVIERLAVDMNAVTHFGGIAFYRSKQVRIQDNYFYDSKPQRDNGHDRYGFFFGPSSKPCEDVWIVNNQVEALQVEVDNVLRVHIVNNRVIRPEHTTGIGWFSQGNSVSAIDIVIRDNLVVDPNKYGINLSLDGRRNNAEIRRITIENNTVVVSTRPHRQPAIKVGSRPEENLPAPGAVWDSIVVRGNRVWYAPDLKRRPVKPAIDVISVAGAGDLENVYIEGNQITGRGKLDSWGIRAGFLKDSVIRNNEVSGARGGIAVSDNLERVWIEGNRVMDIEETAYVFENSAGYNLFSNNVIVGLVQTDMIVENAMESDQLTAPIWLGRNSKLEQGKTLDSTMAARNPLAIDRARGEDQALAFAQLLEGKVEIMPIPVDGWLFRLDAEDAGQDDAWYADDLDLSPWTSIEIAEWWENQGHPGYDGTAWYRRSFKAPEMPANQKIQLAFGAVDEEAVVYLNGREIGRHEKGPKGWDEPFVVDASEAIRPNEQNTLVVRVTDTTGMGGIWKGIKLLATTGE